MWLMLQQPNPDDFVIATGKTYSVRDLVKTAFSVVDLDWEKFVKVDKTFLRPAEVDLLVGDASKAKKVLGWEPQVSFEKMIGMMVTSDMQRLSGEK
jgi:GDPmannose 4,6-dehydratase